MEIICALLVMAVLAVFFTPRGWVEAPVAQEAEVLRSHLRYAESLAMANNTATWSVRLSASSYALWRNNELSPIPFPGENSAHHTLASGVQIAGGSRVIPFNQFGAPENNHVIVLGDGRRSRPVTMYGFTGFVP